MVPLVRDVDVVLPPPEIEAHPVAFPFARIPVGAFPVEHKVGVAARLVAVGALPEVFPVPPCPTDSGVVSPVRDVILEFAPLLAAPMVL
jgi:hypothetical protein